MPAVRYTSIASSPSPPSDLFWTGNIIVSVTMGVDGVIKDPQARIDERVPASFYRMGYSIQIIENPLPAARHKAEEDAKRDAIRGIDTAGYPRRAAACRGEFTVTWKIGTD